MLAFICSCLLFLTFNGCKEKNTASDASERVIARVYDKYLYVSDIRNLVPKGASKNDSLTIIRSFVQNWIQQQAVLKRAEDNLDDESKNVDTKL
jgi:hypothetical protein